MLSFSFIFYLTSDSFDQGKNIYAYIKQYGLFKLKSNQLVEAFGWLIKTSINIFLIQLFYSLYEQTIKKEVDTLITTLKKKYWSQL